MHLAAATEQEANQVAAKHSADVERLSTELASSRDDYKRQVKIMDILNSQYQQAMSAHEEEIDELQVWSGACIVAAACAAGCCTFLGGRMALRKSWRAGMCDRPRN